MSNPYPVTSWSVVNSLGTRTEQVMQGLRSGVPVHLPSPPETGFPAVCGAVSPDLPALEGDLAKFDSRNNRFVVRALDEMAGSLAAARERWGAGRVGICVGSSTAAMDEIERAHRLHVRNGATPAGFDVLSQGSADGLVRVLRACLR